MAVHTRQKTNSTLITRSIIYYKPTICDGGIILYVAHNGNDDDDDDDDDD